MIAALLHLPSGQSVAGADESSLPEKTPCPRRGDRTTAVPLPPGPAVLVGVERPRLLHHGMGVRTCHWEGRVPDQGKQTRYVLDSTLLVVVKLTDGGEHRVQYMRAILTALIRWMSSHKALQPCCYREEPNKTTV